MIDPELATQAIRLALAHGASDAECTISEGEEFTASVRMRSLETLKDAGSRGAGLRVLIGKQVGSSYTSDLSAEGMRKLVESALEIAVISTEDPHAGLPDESELGSLSADLRLYSDDINSIDTTYRIAQALEAEEAALSADSRITNSEGASFRPGRNPREPVRRRQRSRAAEFPRLHAPELQLPGGPSAGGRS